MEYRTEPPKLSGKTNAWLAYRQVERQRREYLERQGDKRNPPEKFYIRHDHFVQMFNEDFELKGAKRLTRRKLQYYSSPQAKLMPYPVRRGHHTSHYSYPDDYERLAAIWALRENFFLPIPMIRTILDEIPPEDYEMVARWDGAPEDLLDTIIMFKEGFDSDDIDNYSASKNALGGATLDFLRPGKYSEEELKNRMLASLERHYLILKEWFSSGKGVRFWSRLAEVRRKHPDFRQRVAKHSQSSIEPF
jgi:hypothetical protein